jgi:HSP20 family molecular chaperone IbpA
MSDKQMAKQEGKLETAHPLYRVTPAVDIYETDNELVMHADLPGVAEQDLQIEVAHGTLTLEAEQVALKGGAKKTYFRQFKLSERINADAGEALMRDGVLTLKLPKTEEAKPKKIAVKTLH